MSKVVDQRVVEMQFDNRQFEKNVAGTMSTLEKLKSKLNFSGSTKGLEDIGKAARNVDMSGLSAGIQTVTTRFSAMQVMGVTALANITNSAVNAGKRMARALTIEPVTTGFKEYELKLDSVKTIMASTGESVETVNSYLEELNKYSDQTIYSFSDMTQNIGKFTNAGVKLEDAVMAIKGISNEAAVSGANANEASRAMYNFAQALSAGYVKLMDWKSIELANMATVEFKQQLIDAAVAAGTLTKSADGVYKTLSGNVLSATKNFNETLQDEWMTTEVLVNTLKDYADETTEIGKKAFAAAQDVTKLTQMFDILKETAQSGWAKTWELLFGDLEQSKEFLTGVTNALSTVIETFSNVRNSVLGGALNSKWDKLIDKIEAAGITAETFESTLTETLEEVGVDTKKLIESYGSLSKAFQKGKIPANILTKALKKLLGAEEEITKTTENMGKIVDEVISGKWGKGQERWDALTKAGYNWAEVQNEVNKKLGSTVTHFSELTAEQKKNAEQMALLSDEQLRAKGYTDEQIVALKELKKAADEGGTSINELITSIQQPSGRDLLVESVHNIMSSIGKIMSIIQEAWDNIFDTSIAGFSDGLYGLIEGFHGFTESLTISEEAANNFRTIMEGVFAGLNISWGVFKGGLNASIKLATSVLGLFGTNLGEVIAYVAELVIELHNWINENTMFINMTDKIAKVIHAVLVGIHDVIMAFWELEIVQEAVGKLWEKLSKIFGKFALDFESFDVDGIVGTINKAFGKLVELVKSLDSNDAARNFILGLIEGLGNGVEAVIDIVVNLGKAVLNALKKVWDEHSPSKEAEEIGENFMIGLFQGLKEFFVVVYKALKTFGTECLKIVEKIDFGKVFAASIIIFALWVFKKLVDVVEALVSPVKAVNDMLNSLGGMFTGIKNAITGVGKALENHIEARTKEVKSKAILNYAIAIGILAASMWALSKVRWQDLVKAGVAIGAITAMIAGLMWVAGKTNKAGELNISSGAILAVAVSLVLVAHALKELSYIPLENVPSVLATMAIAVAALIGVVVGFAKLATPRNEVLAVKMGWILLQISAAFYLMMKVVKLAASLSGGEIASAVSVIAQVGLIFLAFIAVSKLSGKNASRAGSMLLKMSIAMGIMVAVITMAAMLSASTVNKGMETILKIGLLFAAVIAVSNLAGQWSSRAGSMILKMSAGMLFMVGAIALIALMDQSDIEKGIKTIAQLEILFGGLIAVSKFAGANASKAGTMLFMISGAMLLLTGVIYVLSTIDPSGLGRATAAISTLLIIFGGLIAVTSLAKECKLTMITLAVVVGLLSLALATLSFIPTENLGAASKAISTVIATFAALIVATKFAKNTKQMVRTLITLTIITGLLAALVAGLTLIKDPGGVMTSVQALSLLMLSFAGMMVIMSHTGRILPTVSKNLLPLLGVVASLGLIVAGLTLIKDPEGLITSVTALAILMAAFAGTLLIMANTGRILPTVSKQLIPLLGVVAGLALMLGLLTSCCSNVDAILPVAVGLSTLLLTLSAVCVILSMVGKFGTAAVIGATALSAVITILGAVAIALGMVMDNLSSESMETVKSGINKLMDLLSTLARGLGEVIGSFFGGLSDGFLASLPEIGTHLSNFMTNAMVFVAGAKMVDGDVLAGVGILAAAIIALSAADFINGILNFSLFGDSFSTLGLELSKFMTYATPFIVGAKMIDETVADGIKALAQTILILTAADVLSGLSAFFGNKTSLSDFGNELAKFGPSLAAFADTVAGMDSAAVSAAAEATRTLADMAGALPNSGGLAGLLAGENDMDTFGHKLVVFGKHLKNYSTAVTGLAVDAIKNSAEGAKELADMASEIPNLGGMVSWFTGDNDLQTFGHQLVIFGRAIANFSNTVSGNVDVGSVKDAAKAGKAIAELAESIPNTGGLISGIVGDNTLTAFAQDIAGFVTTLNDLSTDGITRFSDALTDLGETGIEDIIAGFSSASHEIETAVLDVIDDFIKAVERQRYRFKNAGKDMADGFADGIDSQTWRAQAKARAMAKAAAKAAEEELDINSPSKVGYSIGGFFGLGFVNALGDYAKSTYRAGRKIAENARIGLSDAVTKIREFVSSDIDAQPTIRPVMDLSDVRTGAAAISGMFGSPIGTLSTAGNINLMMNRRNQNGANSDVVSAIDKLNKKLDNAGNTYNSINGINISGDSDLDDAFQTIVRYAKIERRV